MKTFNRTGILVIIFFGFVYWACKPDNEDPKPNLGEDQAPLTATPVPNGLPNGITLFRDGVMTPHTKLATIPWSTLQPGDIIFLKGGVYHEKIVLSQSGTQEKFIRIVGVPDSNGNLPVIDGANATSFSGEHLASGTADDLNTRSLICIANRPGSNNWGRKIEFIGLENLEIRNASSDFTFTIDGGAPVRYDDFTAAIWVDRIHGFELLNCVIHNSATGVFINSKAYDEPNNADISKDIRIEANHFYDNGKVGSYLEHNTYVEAINALYQFNRYERLKNGALGSTLKDRSAGTVVRYNWMDASARILDLVEAESGAKVICNESSYRTSFVYGNIFYNGPQGATLPFHYGGDKYDYKNYRKGTLYFYNNTIINEADQRSEPGRYYTIMFHLPSSQEAGSSAVVEVVDCRNNIIINKSEHDTSARTGFYWLANAGKVNLGVNLVSEAPMDAQRAEGTNVLGKGNLIVESFNPSWFSDFLEKDFRPVQNSPAWRRSENLSGALLGYPVTMQYLRDRQAANRSCCSDMDLGALESW